MSTHKQTVPNRLDAQRRDAFVGGCGAPHFEEAPVSRDPDNGGFPKAGASRSPCFRRNRCFLEVKCVIALPDAILRRFLELSLLVSFVFATATEACSAPPTLTHLFPGGGQRGTKVKVTCVGAFTWPTMISCPGIEIAPLTESGQMEIAIPADLAADRIWIRLYNPEGASVLQPFLIGGFKEITETEPNDRIGDLKALDDVNVTINGVLRTAEVDCFAVTLAAGQTLVAALDANTRLGSPMDAVLQIVSSDGIVLAENHDDLKLDPRLAYTVPRPGTYLVRLFAFGSAPDAVIGFNGGAGHVYRLTLTTGPYVTHSVPLSASMENPGTVTGIGWNLPPATALTVVPQGGGKLGDHVEFELFDELRRSSESRIGFASAPGIPTSTRVRLTRLSVVQSSTQTDVKNPLPISTSSSVTGCLKSRGQADHYQISLTKGQQVLISAEARSLDLPLDPVLKLFDSAGSLLSEVDDVGPSRDAFIGYTAAQDGDVRITVSDRLRQTNDRNWYLLSVRLEEPDFELAVTADSLVVTPDKPTEFSVKVQRRGPAMTPIGPITIQASGLPDGVSSAAVISEPTGPTATEVKLSLSSTGSAFSGSIRIVGKAALPKEIERFARTPPRLGVAFESIWLTAVAKP